MGKKSDPAPPPPAPDPYRVAQAQTGSNVNTAIANSILQNANEISPWGTVTYKQVGSTRIGDPASGGTAGGGGSLKSGGVGGGGGGAGGDLKSGGFGGLSGLFGGGGSNGGYDIPQFQRVVTLSPEQQKLYDQQTRLGGDLNQFAIDQTGRLRTAMSEPFTTAGLPDGGWLPSYGGTPQTVGGGTPLINPDAAYGGGQAQQGGFNAAAAFGGGQAPQGAAPGVVSGGQPLIDPSAAFGGGQAPQPGAAPGAPGVVSERPAMDPSVAFGSQPAGIPAPQAGNAPGVVSGTSGFNPAAAFGGGQAPTGTGQPGAPQAVTGTSGFNMQSVINPGVAQPGQSQGPGILPQQGGGIPPTVGQPGAQSGQAGFNLQNVLAEMPWLANADPAARMQGINLQQGFGDVGQVQRSIGPTDYSADRQRVEDAIYSRINPQLDRDRATLENTLVNQGLARGSEAFNQEMDAANRQANDARMQAVLAGGGEQSRLAQLALQSGQFANTAQGQAFQQAMGRAGFGNEAQMAQQGFNNQAGTQNLQNQLSQLGFNNANAQQQFGNQADRTRFANDVSNQLFGNTLNLAQARDTQRERALQERLAMRNQPINEISALMSGGQVTAPQFSPYQGGTVGNTPIGDYMYNSAALNNQNYATQMQQKNAAMGGLFGLGQAGILGAMKYGPAMFASDRRLKRDIVDIGIRLGNGLKLYAYRYINDAVERIGLMADDVAKIIPEAVHDIGGFKAVDYRMATGAA